MTREEIRMAIMDAEARMESEEKVYCWFRDRGLSPEISSRLAELVHKVKTVGGRVYHVGKIVVMKIKEFVERHPYVVIGALVGAAVSVMINSIPLIGPWLAPIAATLTIPMGMVAGLKLEKGERVEKGFLGLLQSAIELAKEFFSLLIELFNAVFSGAKEACHVA